MILVAGATGNVGSALLEQLSSEEDAPLLRGLTRNPANASFPSGVEAVEGDLAQGESLRAALTGTQVLFLPARVGADDREVIQAAGRAGVEHVVLVSSITVETHPHLPAAQQNHAVENLLRESGMAWTILRPTQFASNGLWWSESIRRHGFVRLPYPDVELPTIHPADIAAVARVAMTRPGHHDRIYALTGPERISARQQVEAIGEALGQALVIEEISRTQARTEMTAIMDEATADAILDVTGGDVNDGLLRVRDTVPRVTGAAAQSFRHWAIENTALFR